MFGLCLRRLPVVAIVLVALQPAAAAPPAAAGVSVYGTHQGGNVVYHYQVRNNAAGQIRRFYLGCDCRSLEDTGLPELQTRPVHAHATRTDDFGTWYQLPPDAVGHPPGWRVRLLRPHGARGHWLEWYMPAVAGTGIAPGATLGGFSVTLPRADETYLVARYALHGPGASTAGGTLLLADTTPPQLSLTVTAVADEPGVTAQVHVDAVATDDRDPEPRVAVESVGRPDDGAPGYTVLYSATDASGNRATASRRVPWPADRLRAGPAPSLPPRVSLP